MQYVSIYRLAELCDVDPEKLDILSIRDLQNKLKNLYKEDSIELYQLGDDPVTLKEALDWLWKSSSSDNLNFCKWVHSIPALETYLETRKIDLTQDATIPNEIKKSFNFLRFGNFLEPFIEHKLIEDIKSEMERGRFEKVNVLLQFSSLLSRSAQYGVLPAIEHSVNEMQRFFESQVDNSAIIAANFQFLQTAAFREFLNNLDKSLESKKELLLKTITRALNRLTNPADAGLRAQIASNLNITPTKSFSTPEVKIIAEDVNKPAPAATVQVHPKAQQQKPKPVFQNTSSSNRPKVSPWSIIAIGFGVIVLLVRILNFSSSSNYDYDYPDVSMPDYDELWGDSEMTLDLNWESQLAEIRDYAEMNENLDQTPVGKYNDWHNTEAEEELSEPFIDFFYPLYNKPGEDGFKIINETDYAVIIMVKGEEDCYTYFVENKSTYEEAFELERNDELVFYFGKEYEETKDLIVDEVKGFRYVDQNTLNYLDSIFVVGSGISPGDVDDDEIEYRYKIKITERNGKPKVQFDYYRSIKSEEWWNL